MKRMIITPNQLKAINEAALTYVNDMNPSTLVNATNGAQGNIVTAKLAGGTGPKQAATLAGLQNGSERVDPNASSVEITKDPTKDETSNSVFENRYSKRQVELGRILEMRRTGKVYAKKQLNEMFMETTENADILRQNFGQCYVEDILDGVKEYFPDGFYDFAELIKNPFAEITEYIIQNFFSKKKDDGGANDKTEKAFLRRIGALK